MPAALSRAPALISYSQTHIPPGSERGGYSERAERWGSLSDLSQCRLVGERGAGSKVLLAPDAVAHAFRIPVHLHSPPPAAARETNPAPRPAPTSPLSFSDTSHPLTLSYRLSPSHTLSFSRSFPALPSAPPSPLTFFFLSPPSTQTHKLRICPALSLLLSPVSYSSPPHPPFAPYPVIFLHTLSQPPRLPLPSDLCTSLILLHRSLRSPAFTPHPPHSSHASWHRSHFVYPLDSHLPHHSRVPHTQTPTLR